MPERPTVHAHTPTHTFSTWRGHALTVWRGSPGVEAVDHLGQVLEACASANPGRAAYLSVLEPSLSMPGAALREGLVMLTRRFSAKLACAALALPGSGVGGVAARSVVEGLRVMVRPKYPLHCFDTIAEMAIWSQDHLERAGGTLGPPADVEAAFAALRSLA